MTYKMYLLDIHDLEDKSLSEEAMALIDDKRRGAYNRGIAAWSDDHAPLISVSLEAQKRFQGKMELCKLFQYARYPEPYQGGKL